MNNEKDLADLVETGDLPPPPETPHPLEAGAPPDEWPGDDGAEDDPGPLDLPSDWRTIDPDLIAQCARQPQNDTGNGQRLLAYFAGSLLNVREAESQRAAGWHQWSGTHWTFEAGVQAATLAAQKTAARIALEADYISATPSEAAAITAAEDALPARKRLKAETKGKAPTDEQREELARLDDLVVAGKLAVEAIKSRQNKRRQFAISSGNDARIRAMLNQATPHRTISQNDLDRDPYAFNVGNGTVRFQCDETVDEECPDPDVVRKVATWSARLDPHNPADLISKLAPVDYKPAATAPKFLASLERFQPSAAVRDWLQRYYGYGITGLHGEQCLVFHGGGGSNWKSTFTEIVFRVIGDYGAMLKFESLAGEGATTGNQASPDIARLPGARLVRASEPDRGVPLKEGLIKSITGGEPMLARHNFGNFFQFYPVFKLTLSGNHKPDIGGVDHGIWRRMRYVIWPVTIGDDERREFDEVIAELWQEREGILNWLVEGALKYLSEGLKPPPEIVDATQEYRDDMDPVGGFIDQCLERLKATDADAPFEPARAVYDAFVAWSEANAVRPWKEKSFAAAMSQKGIPKVRNNQGRRYIGVRLHDVPARARRHPDEPPHPADDEVPA